MKPFPHHYVVTSSIGPQAEVVLETAGVTPIRTALPEEFGGPGNLWSPETLLVGAIADCYAITFRGIAKRSHLEWTSLALEVTGVLNRANDVTRFTDIHIRARLLVPDCTREELATRVLTKAEQTCLITRSMTSAVHLSTVVECATHRAIGAVA